MNNRNKDNISGLSGNRYREEMDAVRTSQKIDLSAELKFPEKKAPAAVPLLRYAAVLLLGAGLIFGTLKLLPSSDGTPVVIAESTMEKTDTGSASQAGTQQADTAPAKPAEEVPASAESTETVSDNANHGAASGRMIRAKSRDQIKAALAVQFGQMDKELSDCTTEEFISRYPETGEAYAAYNTMLHSDNPFFHAEMICSWFDPEDPDNADGPLLLVGIRTRSETNTDGLIDSLNDEEHPAPDTENVIDPGFFNKWIYRIGFIYAYDEETGILTPVSYPGIQLELLKDHTFVSETVVYREEMNETGSAEHHQFSDTNFFSVDADGTLTIEAAIPVLHCWTVEGEAIGTTHYDEEILNKASAADELCEKHGGIIDMHDLGSALMWSVLE